MSITQTISILGCGWLGLPLGAALVEAGFTVRGSTTSPEKLPRIAERGLEAFLLTVGEEIDGEKVDAFFRADLLIIDIPPGSRQPGVEERFPAQIGLIGERARTAGVRRLLFVSSTGVYGDTPGVFTEADRPVPDRPGGRALLRAEDRLRDTFGSALTILRPGGLAGGDRQPGRWLAGRKDLAGASEPVNLIHREDVIGVILAVIRQEKWGETFHLVADEHPTRQVFYTAQARKLGLEPPSFREEDGKGGKLLTNEKVKKELGYRFRYPDPEGFE